MMAGVYGEFIGFFPELFESFDVYKQTPDAASGYKLSKDRTISGIRQSVARGIDEYRKRQLLVMDIKESYWFWSYDRLDPATELVEMDGRMFRPMSESLFNREGGFYETRLDALVGNDGTKNYSAPLAKGVFQ